jgi:hypothetical protein
MLWISDGCQHQTMPTDADQPGASSAYITLLFEYGLHRGSAGRTT